MSRPDGATDEVVTALRAAFRSHAPDGRTFDADTNFFEAGFTSVSLAAVLTEAAAPDTPLALVDLFRFPTLRALVAELDRRAPRATGRPVAGAPLPWGVTSGER